MNVERQLRDADARGVAPPQDWTTRAADELEALRKDAERYRWLRKRQVECAPHISIAEHAAQKFDAAIDAAMKDKP